MNRLEAAWEQLKTDRASNPNEGSPVRTLQDIAIKAHDAFAEIIPSALGVLSRKDYRVVQRDGAFAGTRAAVHDTLNAQWFGDWNPLNVIAKATTAFVQLPDGLIRDGLHLGRGKKGTVIQTAA